MMRNFQVEPVFRSGKPVTRKLIQGKRRILFLKALILKLVHRPLIRDGPDVASPETREHLEERRPAGLGQSGDD